MTTKEIKELILTDDTFLQTELDSIISYYQLKHTIRWAHDRTEDETESVAEHVYGLHILIDYFFPLVTEDTPMDLELVRQLATWHDMAEGFVGDMTTRTKTIEHQNNEKIAEAKLIETSPKHLTAMLKKVYEIYDARTTPESQFVKALDKIEPQFHLYFL